MAVPPYEWAWDWKRFDPREARDRQGRWTDSGGVVSAPSSRTSTVPSAFSSSAKVRQEFGQGFTALGRNRWPVRAAISIRTAKTVVRRGRQTQHVPDGELVFKRGQTKPTEIRLRDLSDYTGDRPSPREAGATLVHEAAHYLDWLLLNKPDGLVVKNQVIASAVEDQPSPAMKRFTEITSDSPTVKRLRVRGDFGKYNAQPSELWARAYTQWAMKGQVSDRMLEFDMAWPKKEFAPIGAAVEDVLKEAGLL